MRLAAAVIACLAGASLVLGQPAPLRVAAASDLQTALPGLARAFERRTGVPTTIAFGSSGSLFAQIGNGAPYDVFLSADVDYPRQLIAAGHGDRASLYEYATGRLVLWTRRDSGIAVQRGVAALREARVRRIAIANPRFAPYGRAAVAALQSAGIYDAIKGKLVLGENIAQAAQLADSGNADVAILSHALALGPALRASGLFVAIPATAHPPIQQAAVVVAASSNRAAALRFIAFLKQPDTQATLRAFGFIPADAR